jgi:hypothetical protein
MTEQNAGIWKAAAYALGALSQALIMMLLFMIFGHLDRIDDKVGTLAIQQAKMEGVLSTININNPAEPVNRHKIGEPQP